MTVPLKRLAVIGLVSLSTTFLPACKKNATDNAAPTGTTDMKATTGAAAQDSAEGKTTIGAGSPDTAPSGIGDNQTRDAGTGITPDAEPGAPDEAH